jgi:NADPH:quinone reductase-like Zn-dependent oxidoreductase
MMCAIAHHQLRPVVEDSYGLAELTEALVRLEGQHHFGKVAIAIDNSTGGPAG